MKRLCIIPCGKKKIWDVSPDKGAQKAKDAYIGTFHHYCQSYTSMFFTDWVILSAKHGFLLPDDIVEENYDVGFHHKTSEVISISSLLEQMKKKQLDGYDEVVLLAGKKHQRIVEQLFPKEILHYPLTGCKGIGYMNQRLKQAVENKEEI